MEAFVEDFRAEEHWWEASSATAIYEVYWPVH